MTRKLDLLLIRSFAGPFIGTFFVSLFVLVMQFFYIYMDDLIGKGLGTWTLLQLMAYMAATLVPIAMPLAVLLASIMTLGAHGEAYELVAVKASGISLMRFIRSSSNEWLNPIRSCSRRYTPYMAAMSSRT